MLQMKTEIDLSFAEYLDIKNKTNNQITIGDRYPFADAILKDEFENSRNDLSQIYKKVVLLNALYSTNIYSTFDVAILISKIENFKLRVKNSDLTLVDEIRKNKISGKDKDFYSFATKYCHHHNPNCFPIYDSFVEKSLLYYFKIDLIKEKIAKNQLKEYAYFKSKLDLLILNWRLPSDYIYMKVDKFLWKKGKELNK